jgi:L-arabinose transport system substrate-binding protein
MPRNHVRGAFIAAGVAAAMGLTACSSGKESGSSGEGQKPVSGKVSITYLQKQGDQEYFIGEAQGAQAKAKELGVDLKVVNLGEDANKTVSEAQAAIAQKTSGLIVVVPDPAVGPQVSQLAQSANVPLLASDDQICKNGTDPDRCAKDQLTPRVGFSGTQMGTEVGKRAGEEYKKAGWSASDTAIISAWQQDVTVCTQRVKAAQQAFKQASGAGVRVVNVGTDNSPTDAQSKVAAAVSGNRSVKHWVVWGCNDENVSGGVTAIQNAGYQADDVIGVGLGAYLACKDWRGGKPTGIRAALFINGHDVGGLAVQTLYDQLKNGKPMPAEAFAPTKMVDKTNWQQSGVRCS